jgi:SAM-dependent methyltransferase
MLQPEHDSYRAKKSTIAKHGDIDWKNVPDKIDLGCCFRKPEGYWGTDFAEFTGVDQVFNHAETPWPLPDDHFKTVRAWHILQFLPDINGVMREIWRISKPGARVTISVPYYMSHIAFGDPANVSFFNELSFAPYTENSWYAEEANALYSKSHFTIIKQEKRTTGRLRKFIPFKRVLGTFLWNIYDELVLELEVQK